MGARSFGFALTGKLQRGTQKPRPQTRVPNLFRRFRRKRGVIQAVRRAPLARVRRFTELDEL